jgi:SAM-dependent methyltransferase
LNYLAEHTKATLYGIEISQSAIDSFTQMPFSTSVTLVESPEKSKYDLVICCEVIGYISDTENFLKTTYDSLLKDGLFIVSATNLDNIGLAESNTGMKGFTPSHLESIAQEAGFATQNFIPYGGYLIKLIHKLRGHVGEVEKIESRPKAVLESWRTPGEDSAAVRVLWKLRKIIEMLDFIGMKSQPSGFILVLKKIS